MNQVRALVAIRRRNMAQETLRMADDEIKEKSRHRSEKRKWGDAGNCGVRRTTDMQRQGDKKKRRRANPHQAVDIER